MMKVYAASSWDATCFSKLTDAEGVATIQCLESMFENIVRAIMALTGVGLFVILVVGGYHFLLSGGDPKKLEAARGTLTNAIIGLVIIVCAFLIILTVSKFTGVEKVTEFTIPK